MATSFGILTTYPPTQCGLATFSFALTSHLHRIGADVGIVSVVDTRQPEIERVSEQLALDEPDGVRTAARALNRYDVAVVQHEYGIFGGRDGDDVLDVMARLRVPVIVVLHTVLTEPTPHQHAVLAGVVKAATVAVTMTATARDRLIAGWDVDPADVVVIAHGAEENGGEDSRRDARPAERRSGRPTILTWGLLGEGKGIEWALEAMAGLADLHPAPLYRVVGETHPKVLERDGDAYRERLQALVLELGISPLVEFDGRYLDGPTLRAVVRGADVILLPYDSREQVTSGVLTEAVAAGKPVVSTRFPHAVELLSSGAGLLVPQRDPAALRDALRRVLTEPQLAASMAGTARDLSAELLWPAIAGRYVGLGQSLVEHRSLSVA